ncbi:hypothetical protein [Pseudoxanthomonas sacheonensis]|uniref:Anti-sigma-K factor RskA n=1 Tax=Pseudoxanthomonas sacheonensis TaxID=443615 RepID=A0ABU1RW02_9GAMM|nr:hypothetical protein [Pseudoxanthomonas sacheonensis]MDR6842961.1 anti-sigma-K factor RskA [Pseudoxanthomonas sacheonensis]
MNPGIGNEKTIGTSESFDGRMRQLHAAAVTELSPQTLARLRNARQQAQTSAPRRGHAWRWATATAFSAVLAVTIGLQLLPKPNSTPAAQPVVATLVSDDVYADSVSALDENPDLYMWLASSEAEPLAME